MERLMEETLRSLPNVFIDPELEAVKQELASLGDIANRFRAVCKVRVAWVPAGIQLTQRNIQTGLEQLFNQLTRPRLRSSLDDCYKDVSYALNEDSFVESEEQNVVRKRFVRAWEGLVEGYRVMSILPE